MIAIDGPAAAGKTTVASKLASCIGALFFDTGVIYRTLALVALERAIDPADSDRLTEVARSLPLRISPSSVDDGRVTDVVLDDRDVTWEIRSPAVDRIVSAVSAHPSVRAALLGIQRRIARHGRVVLVGRDIGTVVVPNADLKIWLDASLDERARRRTLDLERQGKPHAFEDVRNDMAVRDDIDAARDAAPMKASDDAVVLVTDNLSADDVVARIVELLRQRVHGEAER